MGTIPYISQLPGSDILYLEVMTMVKKLLATLLIIGALVLAAIPVSAAEFPISQQETVTSADDASTIIVTGGGGIYH